MNDGWFGALKEMIQQQQNQLVWVSEGKVRHTHTHTKLTTNHVEIDLFLLPLTLFLLC